MPDIAMFKSKRIETSHVLKFRRWRRIMEFSLAILRGLGGYPSITLNPPNSKSCCSYVLSPINLIRPRP